MHRPRKRGALAPAHAVHMRDSPDTTNRDLGAGQTQTTRSGSSGMDAARAPSGHGCPFGADPRSVVGVRVPDEGGPNQELGTFGYFWCLFKSDPPEGRKGESAPPERMDLLTLPMPNPANPTNPPAANLKTVRRSEADRCVAFDSAGGVVAAGVALHFVPRSAALRSQSSLLH
ncbi:hypothetical protein SAMN03159444_01102 [Pseudomonas sp. NFACC02]|nr:hypothetical protein SAMN03159444_01102 [Pseudomonas sp. NFACC02]